MLLASVAQAQSPIITTLSPARNASAVPRNTEVRVGFDQPLRNTTSTQQALKVYSQQAGGKKVGTTTVRDNTLRFTPSADFKPGEPVSVTITTEVESQTPNPLARPQVFQFTTATAPSPGLFASGTNPTVALGPIEVLTGDIDGDGDLDVLSANQNSSSISVLRNDGQGSFSDRQELNADLNPQAAALGDFDQDGDLDLVVTSAPFPAPGSSIRIFLNNGQGSFRPDQQLGVGNSPIGLAVGDVDGDGDLDLLTANSSSNSVSVRYNNGAAVFSRGQEVETNSQPSAVVLADVNSDGTLDLLTTNRGSRSVSVRFNNGTFFSPVGQEITVGSEPISLAVNDLDGDGDADLVASNYFDGNLSVRFNDGTGFFIGGHEVRVGQLTANLVLGDIDGDQDFDILAASSLQNKVSVLRNSGRGTFSLYQEVPVNGAHAVALGDVDNDGTLDLLASAFIDNQLNIRFNRRALATASAAVAAQVSLYPNPASEVVQLRMPVKLAQPGGVVRVLNSLGQVVREQDWSASHTDLVLGPLAVGVYSVRVQTKEGVVTKRLMVR